jgi:hypothetical protein
LAIIYAFSSCYKRWINKQQYIPKFLELNLKSSNECSFVIWHLKF